MCIRDSLSHEGFSSYDVGVSWWSLDHHLGIRHSQLNSSLLSYGDLRRYNTIILPSGYGLDEADIANLKDWVNEGGTLIAHNSSSRMLASEFGMGSVRQVQQTFENSEEYNIDLQREILALNDQIDIDAVLSNKANIELSYPWESRQGKYNQLELSSRDKWQSLFMPSGAIVAGRIDNQHWLTFGSSNTLPVLYSNYPVLMTGGGSKAAVRIGELSQNTQVDAYRTINWSDIPPGNDLNVRMSGLVWPEAAQRIANSAYLTQERYGRGQLILFAGEPNFRAAALGTNRLWLNAVIYGAGLGARQVINP